MPPLKPVKRRELIGFLRQLGFAGPYSGSKHQFMIRADRTVRIPNPHKADIGRDLLVKILRQAGIGRSEWEGL